MAKPYTSHLKVEIEALKRALKDSERECVHLELERDMWKRRALLGKDLAESVKDLDEAMNALPDA